MANVLKIISDKELSIFFSEYPLYSKLSFCEIRDNEEELEVFNFFQNKAYKFYCPYDKDYHTFKFSTRYASEYLIKKNTVPEVYLDKDGQINITFHLESRCQICNYRMDVLLNLFSENVYFDNSFINLSIKKEGQWPAFERNPGNDILNYLTEEDKDNYKKALACLAVSYGIGAFAYLRRIIENEIKRLVKDISELEYDNAFKVKEAWNIYESNKVKEAWNIYESNHQMSNLIESINSFLPKSFIDLGYNPIKVLHQQTSGGLHEFSESICLEKAKDVDKLLRFIIKSVSSLKLEYLDAKNAIKNLMT